MTEAEVGLLRYAIGLLEQIAANGRSAIAMELEDYLGRVQNACGVEGTEEIFRSLRAQSETRAREVPEHAGLEIKRVGVNAGKGASLQKNGK